MVAMLWGVREIEASLVDGTSSWVVLIGNMLGSWIIEARSRGLSIFSRGR